MRRILNVARCDDCGYEEDMPSSDRLPVGWWEVREVTRRPNSRNGRKFDLCAGCGEGVKHRNEAKKAAA